MGDDDLAGALGQPELLPGLSYTLLLHSHQQQLPPGVKLQPLRIVPVAGLDRYCSDQVVLCCATQLTVLCALPLSSMDALQLICWQIIQEPVGSFVLA